MSHTTPPRPPMTEILTPPTPPTPQGVTVLVAGYQLHLSTNSNTTDKVNDLVGSANRLAIADLPKTMGQKRIAVATVLPAGKTAKVAGQSLDRQMADIRGMLAEQQNTMTTMQTQLSAHQHLIHTLQAQNSWLVSCRWLDREPVIMASVVKFLEDAIKGKEIEEDIKFDNTHPRQVFLRKAFTRREHPIFFTQGAHLFDLEHLDVLLSGVRHSVRNERCHFEQNWPMMVSELFGLENFHYRGGPSNCYTIALIYLCVILRSYGFLRPFLDFVNSNQGQYPRIPQGQYFRLWQYL